MSTMKQVKSKQQSHIQLTQQDVHLKMINQIKKFQEILKNPTNQKKIDEIPETNRILQSFGPFTLINANQLLIELQLQFEKSEKNTITTKTTNYKKMLTNIKGLYQSLCEFHDIPIKQSKDQAKKQGAVKLNNWNKDLDQEEEEKEEKEGKKSNKKIDKKKGKKDDKEKESEQDLEESENDISNGEEEQEEEEAEI